MENTASRSSSSNSAEDPLVLVELEAELACITRAAPRAPTSRAALRRRPAPPPRFEIFVDPGLRTRNESPTNTAETDDSSDDESTVSEPRRTVLGSIHNLNEWPRNVHA
jgi:hypothetical protein